MVLDPQGNGHGPCPSAWRRGKVHSRVQAPSGLHESVPPCPVLACSALLWLAWLGPLSCPLPGAGVSLLWGTSQGPALGGASPAKGAREPAGPKQARAAAPSHHKGGGGPKQPGPSEGGPKPSRGGHQARNRGGLGLYVPLTLTLATYEPRLAPRLGLGICTEMGVYMCTIPVYR
jgi:hypothetical protein